MSNRDGRKIRYAVVGLGNISQVAVLPAFAHAKENSELAALISSDLEKIRVLARRYGVPLAGTYDDLEEVLVKGAIDAVYIAVPNSYHRDVTDRAACLGVHVLCEKPMAISSEDCQAMIDVTREHGVKLMIGYRLHFEQANLEAIERIQKGEIGDPRIFSSVFSHQVREGNIRARSETGGGALFDMGVYCVNAARYLFKAEPEMVIGHQFIGTGSRFENVDEMTSALLQFPGGRVAQFTASQGASDVSEYRVVGTKGDLRLDPAYDYANKLAQYLTIDHKTKERTFSKRDQFAPELVHFSRCILEDTEPEPSGEEGLADIRVLEAIAQSSRERRPIVLPPFDRRVRPSVNLEDKKPPVGKIEPVHAPSPSR